MPTPAANLTLGLLQFNPGREVAANLDTIRRLAGQLPGPCDLLVLPENCLCLGKHATVAGVARERDAWLDLLRSVMHGLRCAAVFGGVPVRAPLPSNVGRALPPASDSGATSRAATAVEGGSRVRLSTELKACGSPSKVRNCALVLAPTGELLADYAKIHLFQLNPGKPGGVDETALYTHGAQPVAFDLNGWRIGLSICYDLRFPELYRAYAPADLLLCTAAFTRQTGAAHWHTLLRARAIENQCYMAAAAVCGTNPDNGPELYGHSLVSDPWGTLLVEAPETEPTALRVCLEHARIMEVRSKLPALMQRRLGAT